MLPAYFNVTEECIKNLRQLELEAYSVLVSVLVAQGPLTSDKKKLLKDAARMMHVCVDRHKLEVRRAINDDRLNTIAHHVNAPGMSSEDWCHEGSRSLPLMQRIVPQTLRPIITRTSVENDALDKPEDANEVFMNTTKVKQDDLDQNLPNDHYPKPTPSIISSYESTRPKKMLGKGQKVMIVPNAQSSASNSILHKTLSVPMTKVTKLNLDKFKIIPNSNTASSLQVTTAKAGKKIIPLSQFQILNHRFGPKGSIKVLPLKGKFLGKNITMARITPVKTVPPPLTAMSKNEEKAEEMPCRSEEQETVDFKEAIANNGEDVKKEEDIKEKETGDDLAALMEIDTSELIEPELKEQRLE